MFKHILLPTDGTAASEVAILQAMTLAKENGAKVTGLHVIQPFTVFAYDIQMIESTDIAYMAQARVRAERYVQAIEKAAQEMGVACKTEILTEEHPDAAIIRLAADRGCDLIVMSSHGRRGVKALLLGSETQKVLAHAKTPVLVVR